VGTFVAWEDLPGIQHPDFDYNDLTFVITNVSVSAEIAQFEQPVLNPYLFSHSKNADRGR